MIGKNLLKTPGPAALALLLVASATGQSLLDSQPGDGLGSEISFISSTDNYEAADDIDVLGSITRVYVTGYLPNFQTWGFQGVQVRFYAHTAGGPGALQAEYFVAAGDANLKYDALGATFFDATLPSAFLATGRHYLSVQIKAGWWNWNSAAHQRSPMYKRVNGSAWQPLNRGLTYWVYGSVSGPGRIDSLSSSSATRSGFLIINGANFDGSGEVRIDGLAAPVASWTPTEIVAYVPEAARLGAVGVEVSTAGGVSNNAALTVTDRQASGRLKWRFRMDAPYSMVRPARAADATVYVIDVYSRLYALTPNGALKWIARAAGNKGLALGPDGTIYTGSESDVKAFRPDGTPQWTFVQNPRAFIMLGLVADSAGNTYGVASSGMGVFSLDPNSNERWRTPEPYNRPNVLYSELVLGPNGGFEQLYFYGNAHTRAVRTSDGSSVFTIGGLQPVVSPFDGTVHLGSSAYTPNGQLLWSYSTGYGVSTPDVGTDGIHYFVSRATDLFALRPDGTRRWSFTLPKNVAVPDVDPTNSLVLLGGSNTLDIPGFLQGISTSAQAAVWEQALPAEETSVFNGATGQYGFNQFQDTRARYTPDGKTAYLGTAIAPGGSGVRNRCFLNAIDTGVGSLPPPISFKLRVASIDLSATNQGYVLVTSVVKVVDSAGVPVPYATVQATWKGPGGGVFNTSGTTSNAGMISFVYGYSKGTYTFTVTKVTKPGYTFDTANSVLKKTIKVQ